jgi:2'-5' RNA ligase
MRLFAGIPLDAAARTFVAIAVDALKLEGFRARWTPAENWHVTLAFLGDVNEAAVPAITSAFHTVQGQLSLAAFSNPRRPRVLWVGGQDQEPQFGAAALALRSAFELLGFHFDDLSTAHVTIGRTTGSAPLRAPRLAAAHAMPVTRLVLFESVRTPAGVRYEEREVLFLSNSVVIAMKKDRT